MSEATNLDPEPHADSCFSSCFHASADIEEVESLASCRIPAWRGAASKLDSPPPLVSNDPHKSTNKNKVSGLSGAGSAFQSAVGEANDGPGLDADRLDDFDFEDTMEDLSGQAMEETIG